MHVQSLLLGVENPGSLQELRYLGTFKNDETIDVKVGLIKDIM